MAKMPVWEEILEKRQWLWGRAAPAFCQAGSILAIKYPDLPASASVVFAADLPGNHWFSIGDSRLPLLADKVVSWPGQAIALAAAPERSQLLELCGTIRPIVQPFSETPWDAGGEIVHSRNIVRSGRSASHSPGKIHRSWSMGSGSKTETHPCEIWAMVKGGELFMQAPGPWPTGLRDSSSRVLGLPSEKIFFQVTGARVPSVTMNAYLLPATLYAALLAIKTGKPIRFLLDDGWKTSWPAIAPEIITETAAVFSEEGNVERLSMTAKIHAGRTGVFIKEWSDRFLQAILNYFPKTAMEIRMECLASFQAPRSPVFGWGEVPAGIFCLNLGSEIEKLVRPDQPDPIPLGHPRFSELLDILSHGTYWPRYWGARGTQRVSSILRRKGMGLGYGFTFSGFMSDETAPFSIRLSLEKEKTVRVLCPMPVSLAVWKKVAGIIKETNPQWEPVLETWYGLDCPETGPAILGRTFEILPELVRRAAKQLSKRKLAKTGPVLQTALYRRPKSRKWNKENFEGEPFLSVGLAVCLADVAYDPFTEDFELLQLHVVMDIGEIEDVKEVEHAVRQSTHLIVRWLWGHTAGNDFVLKVETIRRPGKNPPKAVHNALWSALPHALYQASRQSCPTWSPGFFTEASHED